jgi:hypothetical protein
MEKRSRVAEALLAIGLAIPDPQSNECVHHRRWAEHMEMETKYLRLRTPVELGSRFGDWQVCWLGGWARFRLYYLVMLVKVPSLNLPANRRIDLAFGANRAMNGVAMNTFTIDANSNITAFASLDEARAAKIHNAECFGSLVPDFPSAAHAAFLHHQPAKHPPTLISLAIRADRSDPCVNGGNHRQGEI